MYVQDQVGGTESICQRKEVQKHNDGLPERTSVRTAEVHWQCATLFGLDVFLEDALPFQAEVLPLVQLSEQLLPLDLFNSHPSLLCHLVVKLP